MKVKIEINENYEVPQIIIYTKEITPEISSLVASLQANGEEKIIGILDDRKYLLDKKDIDTFYSENNKVYARVENKIYKVNYKLYQLEDLLVNTSFVRISNSEIINFEKVDSLSLKDSTIYVFFKDKNYTFVSRRYMKKIKKYLKI